MELDNYDVVITAGLPASVSLSLPVDVLLKAVGDTPIMKTKKWAVERGRTIQSLSQFISRFLKLEPNEQLVPFISSHRVYTVILCQEVITSLCSMLKLSY